ncbi:class I SAM-dependent methyltransferase [Paenibacillus mendelii]|uniref:Class I SAM-dependent methyltransferase n=1 Tax=Paenibacillus mendelii TaxID=206163 RepID=A0ABV6J212_9BACL|nr:class I SAM-dependent methyltransferase [Paenibacillus mendelii]MCQ6562850.1 class I SAM-dependent methyltransferase [Paenibacillus mendelii]
MSMKYDPAYISHYYDHYGEQEWNRFDLNPTNKVNFHIHLHYLQSFIRAHDFVLEAGAGAGRFTVELGKIGANIVVGDISRKQLDINETKVHEAGLSGKIIGREQLDIVDLSRFQSESFDKVVCYGGALSYVFDQADHALNELLRVTKKGGYLLLSVMSALGTTRRHLIAELSNHIAHYGKESIHKVIKTGELLGNVANGHHCKMYRWRELEAMLNTHECSIAASSAANFLSPEHEHGLHEIMNQSPELWEQFLQWEIDYCKEPGALDGRTHIIVVVKRE